MDCSLNSIIEEQYQLSKNVNISIVESGELIDFERLAYISLLVRDKRKENEILKANK
jgi:hypothetical protein